MKVDDRRLPRPIGGERSWKGSNSAAPSGQQPLGNLSFPGMDNLIEPQGSVPPPPQGPGGNWLGNMYGGGGNQMQAPQQGPPPPMARNDRGGGNNVLGRRFIEEMDTNRMLELQQVIILNNLEYTMSANFVFFLQMFDGQQRMMNGGNGGGGLPPMMHMGHPPPPPQGMFPFGMDHIEQQHAPPPPMPKLDQGWDSHMLMDDKHMVSTLKVFLFV